MSLIKDGKLVYPLKQKRVKIGDKVVYDRDTRGKSWFILDLAIASGRFIPTNATGLVTVDNETVYTKSRRKDC